MLRTACAGLGKKSTGMYFAFGFFVLWILVGQERLLLQKRLRGLVKKWSEHRGNIFKGLFRCWAACSRMQLGKAPGSVKVLVISVCQFENQEGLKGR